MPRSVVENSILTADMAEGDVVLLGRFGGAYSSLYRVDNVRVDAGGLRVGDLVPVKRRRVEVEPGVFSSVVEVEN